MKKQIFKTTLFLLIALLLAASASLIFERKSACNYSRAVAGFFNEAEDSMDMLFFGSSHMYCMMDAKLLQAEYGLEGYLLSTQTQPLAASWQYMKKALESQSPRYLVLELGMTNLALEATPESAIRDAIDPVPWREGKAEFIRSLVPAGERGSYYFPLAKYHGRWKELSAGDFDFSYLEGRDPERGYIRFTPARAADCGALSYDSVDYTPISDESMDYLLRCKALADEHGAELVFVIAPFADAKLDAGLFKSLHRLAREQDVPILDFNLLYDEAGFDSESDFFDPEHLNESGAAKATEYFARWLMSE